MSTIAEHEFKVIGTRPIRHDGIDKVTGRARYGADYSQPGMLHGKVLRSPHAHARIKSISVEKALQMPGVKAIITSKDLIDLPARRASLGEMMMNPHDISHNILARDQVLYNGHAIAAVAATSPHIAEEALNLIEVEYEPLPFVLNVKDAMAPNAPLVLEDLRNQEFGQVVANEPMELFMAPSKGTSDKPGNIAAHFQFQRGSLEAGFKSADFIVEREFNTQMVHQGYIEPHNALGIYNADGQATLYCSTQGPFEVRMLCSLLLGVSAGKIRVVPAEIGGGFGGKTTIYLEPLALLLSQKTGHPVKLVMTRAEVLKATGPTSGSYMKVKMGATKGGRITAAEISLAFEAGAFPGSPVGPGAMCVIAPYDIPNFLIDGFDVVVNRPKTAAYRAPGATNAAFASESVIDELAEKCGMDPIEFRLKNAATEGTRQVIGPKYGRIGFVEVCEALKKSEHYQSKLSGPNRGRGVAFGFWFNAGHQSSATVNIHGDGTVSVVTGSVDIGGSRAAMAMVAAEVLGISVTDVRPLVADTDSIGQTDCTGGSRVAFATGMAVYEAAQDAVRQLKERAARLRRMNPEDVEWSEGQAVSRNNGVKPASLRELAMTLPMTGGPIIGRATVNPHGVGPTFAGLLVDVEVDPETGKTQVLRCTVAQDAGRAIHPSYVEGQMQGGTVQGLGWALNEEYVYDDKGIMRNAGFLDYRMPTCLDLPSIETEIVEVANPGHPLGVRGVGEVSIVPPPAAVANAIYRAIGVRITDCPMSPPRIVKALKKARLP
ncbi:MAG TPA: xanthine dehydrogenase family protein molybdopterin-binding subunit [Candidatus Binataceae bacterium]|nr:xanthine dehydrogenase family protein molybdopterin-binding subunit [Candidatus Binataceae bacterium]